MAHKRVRCRWVEQEDDPGDTPVASTTTFRRLTTPPPCTTCLVALFLVLLIAGLVQLNSSSPILVFTEGHQVIISLIYRNDVLIVFSGMLFTALTYLGLRRKYGISPETNLVDSWGYVSSELISGDTALLRQTAITPGSVVDGVHLEEYQRDHGRRLVSSNRGRSGISHNVLYI